MLSDDSGAEPMAVAPPENPPLLANPGEFNPDIVPGGPEQFKEAVGFLSCDLASDGSATQIAESSFLNVEGADCENLVSPYSRLGGTDIILCTWLSWNGPWAETLAFLPYAAFSLSHVKRM
jgi:hypothetical protein